MEGPSNPANGPSARPVPLAPRAARVLAVVALLIVAALLGRTGGRQIWKQSPDFEYFYKAGAWLLNHGGLDPGYDVVEGRVEARGSLEWYLPFVSRVMTLFAVLPPRAAGLVWLGLNLLAMAATLRLLGRHLSGLPPRDWPLTQLFPLLLLGAYWAWEFRLNQINNFTLLLLVASFAAWQQGRRGISGFWLGLAILLKLTPVLLVLWFALKRQYRTVAAAIVTVVLAGPVADVIALGPPETIDSYRSWASHAVSTGSHRGLISAQREMDWRNQGLGAVLCRWLHPTNYNTHFDNDPRHQAMYGAPETKTLNVATLSRRAVGLLATGVAGLTMVGLIWLARRPASVMTPWQLRLEWALFILAMLWLMPVMRRYHMIWALPAISLLGGAIHYAGLRNRWSQFALACLALVPLVQLGLPWMRFEAGGAVLASVAVLALPLIVLLLRLARQPTTLPGPCCAPSHPAFDAAGRDVHSYSTPSTAPGHA